jgi:hypothetical protein
MVEGLIVHKSTIKIFWLFGTVAECHFDCNFHISAKIAKKFIGLIYIKPQNLFNNFVSKSENFVAKAPSATVPICIFHLY